MAAAAETLQTSQQTYLDLDLIPGVAEARAEQRQAAWDLIEERRGQALTGETEFLLIDALSTAHHALAVRAAHAEDSPEYEEAFAALVLDCSRLVTEWFRKKRPEYFPESYHNFDPQTQDFYSHGLSIRQMTEAALLPLQNNPEEEARRVNERVEEATPQIVRTLGTIAMGRKIRTISLCPDWAIAAYQTDLKEKRPYKGYAGYVPDIAKSMIRDIRLDDATDGRFEEQLAVPGLYTTPEVMEEALRRCQVDASNKGKTALHGMQLLVNDDILEFQALVDTVAGEQWCTNIFLGEEVPHDHPKDYSAVRAEARERRERLDAHSRMTADFVLSLAEADTDRLQAPLLVEEFVKRMLLVLGRADLDQVTDMFEIDTARGLYEVNQLSAQGRDEEAARLFDEVVANARGGGFCGAGCEGLEIMRAAGVDADAVKKLGFDPKDVIKDTVRRCKCGSQTVFYDLKQAKKGCVRCGQTKKY